MDEVEWHKAWKNEREKVAALLNIGCLLLGAVVDGEFGGFMTFVGLIVGVILAAMYWGKDAP